MPCLSPGCKNPTYQHWKRCEPCAYQYCRHLMSEGMVPFENNDKMLFGLRDRVVVTTKDGQELTGKIKRRGGKRGGTEYVVELDRGGRYYANTADLRKVS